MGASVVNYVKSHSDVIDWAEVNLSSTPSEILWQAFNCTPTGDAKIAIRKELSNRKEF
jgi:hypothetical protein